MPARAISDATFVREVLRSRIPVLVVFSSPSCGPCRTMAVTLDEIAKDLAGKVNVVELDVDRNKTVRSDFKVHGLPTLILFKDGRPVARRVGALTVKADLQAWINSALTFAFASQINACALQASQFKLANGMDVVVIPDHRAPIVTHMVWYKAGAADDPAGASGISHFLKHLTFKSTDEFEAAEFSKAISRLSGAKNACSGRDTTMYFERISKDQLETAMELEVRRMTQLCLTDEAVATERQVLIELHRAQVESNPSARLSEKLNAVLFESHPYSAPAMGWAHELAKLSRKDALKFFKRYYAPNNAVLLVSGDVTVTEALRLAEKTYGKVPRNVDIDRRARLQEIRHLSARRVTLKDPYSATAIFRRFYAVPSYVNAQPAEAETFDLLANILGAVSTGRLYRKLIVEEKLADSAHCGYVGDAVYSGIFSLSVTASHGELAAVEACIDAVLDDIRSNGVAALELERAKKALLAGYIFESDNQERLACRYGAAITLGRSLEQVKNWPLSIARVTDEDIKAAAGTYLDARRSATAWLLNDEDDEPAEIVEGAHAPPVRMIAARSGGGWMR